MFSEKVIKVAENWKGKRTSNLKRWGNAEYVLLVKETKFLPEKASSAQRIWHILNNTNKLPSCHHCKTEHVKWHASAGGYVDFCSSKCAARSPITDNKKKQTCLNKFGVDSYSKTNDFKKLQHEHYSNLSQEERVKIAENRKRTCWERYQVEYPLMSPDIKAKAQKTILEKYGVDNIRKAPEIIQKIKNTIKRRYGVDHYNHTAHFSHIMREYYDDEKRISHMVEKQKYTCLEKYGVISYTKTPEFITKIKRTNQEQRGVDFPAQSSSVQKKREENCLEKYGHKHESHSYNPSAFANLEDYDWLYKQYVDYLNTATQIAKELSVSVSMVCIYLHRHDIIIRRIGKFSQICIQWLESIRKQENIFIQHACNIGEYHIIGTSYYADGYCKETNTIYEFHGDMWHGNPQIYSPEDICHPFNPEITAGELYKKTKTKESEIKRLGYNIVIMWENQWKNLPTNINYTSPVPSS